MKMNVYEIQNRPIYPEKVTVRVDFRLALSSVYIFRKQRLPGHYIQWGQ